MTPGKKTTLAPALVAGQPATEALIPRPSHRPTGRCIGTTKAGTSCRGIATVDGTHCAYHSPRYSKADHTAWGLRGAAASHHSKLAKRLFEAKLSEEEQRRLMEIPDLGNTEKVNKYIEKIVGEVKAGLLPPSLANAINGLLQTKLKVEELILENRLADELDAELGPSPGPRVVVQEESK